MNPETDSSPDDIQEILDLESQLQDANLDLDRLDALSDEDYDPVAASDESDDADPGDEADTTAEAATAETQKASEPEPEPDGVLTKDGKHVIPYKVLENTREQNAALKAQLDEANRKLAATMEKSGVEDAAAKIEAASQEGEEGQAAFDDLLKELNEDDFPEELVKTFKAIAKQNSDLTDRIKKFEQAQKDSEQEAQAATVQEAVDAHPDLRAWQADPDPKVWNVAAQIDAQLRDDPEFADKPLQERLDAVARMTKARFGMPLDPKPSAGSKPKTPATPQEKAPTSMSDIPGGAKPPQSDQEVEDASSPQALEARLSRMSDEAFDEYLDRMA